MTRDQQAKFIQELCDTLKGEITAKIESGEIPENWDGIELRQYASEQICWRKLMSKARAKEYRNTIAITNL